MNDEILKRKHDILFLAFQRLNRLKDLSQYARKILSDAGRAYMHPELNPGMIPKKQAELIADEPKEIKINELKINSVVRTNPDNCSWKLTAISKDRTAFSATCVASAKRGVSMGTSLQNIPMSCIAEVISY